MNTIDVIRLTRKLISFNTVNPPGDEMGIAKYVGRLLVENGFDVKYPIYKKNRLHLIAEKGLDPTVAPIVFSGHFDTVPLGTGKWTVDPFGGEVSDGKIFGRGSSDMKAGLAAMICAAIQAFNEGKPSGGVRLIFTANEETGCLGAKQLTENDNQLGAAKGIIIAEPTANIPAIGHKGGLYMKVSASGVTAHSSMPELGDNAIYKVARAVLKVKEFRFETEKDALLGFPTLNVGTIRGGMNLNSVPDYAEFTIDIRSTTKVIHADLLNRLKSTLGNEVKIEKLVDLSPVSTKEEEPFVQWVYDACKVDPAGKEFPKTLPFLTDGAVLQNYYEAAPTVILGPGQPEMAHQTNEYCYVEKLKEAVKIYKNIMLNGENWNE